MGDITFSVLAVLVIVTAFWVVTSRNLVHAAVALMGTLFGVAGLYVFLYADFMAAVQIIIYVGGITVLIIFGVMLTQRIGDKMLVQTTMPNRAFAAIVVAALFVALASLIFKTPWHRGDLPEMDGTVSIIGNALLTRYLLHFEVAGVLLLLALLGAAYLARRAHG
ncbi:MAG: NADH-quinone oxidoreductase subunit J [Candidatus Marinimicrobia bacterium]|nr:NADH-quinone oxidoreductase subunit J [Candidatus Neomarinimicrobiota bacterium]